MNRLSAMSLTIRYAFARHAGWPGAMGIFLIGFTLLAVFVVAPRWSADTAKIKLQAGSAMVDLNRTRGEHHTRPKTSEQLARFNSWFPWIDKNSGDLQRLVEQAQLVNLILNKGEYHIGGEQRSAFTNYEVVLSVKSDYDTIRRFVSGVLKAIPNASLAELHIERGAVTSTIQEARIHFTFVYRGV
jgi:hypothetical protein